MKIGKFAEQNSLTIDAVRHYMDLSLIIPEKQGGQYEFDERCQKDLDDILNFKSMGFTLNEIKSIFFFKRLGKLTYYQENEYYKNYFNNKLKKISREIEELQNIQMKLGEKIKELSSLEHRERFKMGIDIRALSLLSCFKCRGELVLSDGHIVNNQIISGKLSCSCGEEYIIDNGILLVKDDFTGNDNLFDTEYLTEYITTTSPDYLSRVYEGLEWGYKRLNFGDFKNKIILELGSGMGFFLRNIYNDLPDDSMYIAVDHDIGRHLFLKNMLEMADVKKNVIFICSDYLNMPLKEKVIDIVVDFSGTSGYAFDNEEFLLKLVNRHIKYNSLLTGTYILFKNFSSNNIINPSFRKNFVLKNIKEEIKKLGYTAIDERTSDTISEGGKYEDYFNEDEKVYAYAFYGKR